MKIKEIRINGDKVVWKYNNVYMGKTKEPDKFISVVLMRELYNYLRPEISLKVVTNLEHFIFGKLALGSFLLAIAFILSIISAITNGPITISIAIILMGLYFLFEWVEHKILEHFLIDELQKYGYEVKVEYE